MNIRLGNGLPAVNLLALALAGTVLFLPDSALRIVLGLPFLLFLPGYALVTALFPRQDALDGMERAALSLAVGMGVVPLIGYTLSKTPWGVRTAPVLISVMLFILIISSIGWLRQRLLAEPERFNIAFRLRAPGRGGNKLLSIVLAVAVLSTLGALGYSIIQPGTGERFSEFYLVGDYPRAVKAGAENSVAVVIANHERQAVSYRVEVRLNGVLTGAGRTTVLADGQQQQETLAFTADKAGNNQKLEIVLYKDGEPAPAMAPLLLWLEVTG